MNRRQIVVDGTSVGMEADVLRQVCHGGVHVVLLRPTGHPRVGTGRNLIGIGDDLNVLWRADTPTSQTGDHYVDVVVEADGIRATSFSDRVVVINEHSGRVVREIPWTKR